MTRLNEIIQRNVWASLAVTFVVGTVLGLVVLGWQVWPVQWTDALPADLRYDYQSTYLSMVADSYAQTGDANLAQQRIAALAKGSRTTVQVGQEAAALAQARTAEGDQDGAARLASLATLLGVQPGETGSLPSSPRGPEAPMARFLRICGLVILVLVILAGLLLLVYFLQSRTTTEPAVADRLAVTEVSSEGRMPAFREAPAPSLPIRPAAVMPTTQAAEQAEPSAIGPFVATYNLGDIDFDMSFGIEAANGDFLGECGLGMAETIGGGDVQRVTAFEVWLFDKTDIRTVSVVLASAHADSDPALRGKLASRGEIVMAEMGQSFSIKTSSLQLDGRVLDLAYGGGDVPAESYFTSFSVELVPVPLRGEQQV